MPPFTGVYPYGLVIASQKKFGKQDLAIRTPSSMWPALTNANSHMAMWCQNCPSYLVAGSVTVFAVGCVATEEEKTQCYWNRACQYTQLFKLFLSSYLANPQTRISCRRNVALLHKNCTYHIKFHGQVISCRAKVKASVHRNDAYSHSHVITNSLSIIFFAISSSEDIASVFSEFLGIHEGEAKEYIEDDHCQQHSS